MLEGLVASLLSKYLGDFIEGLEPENLKLAITSGDVELKNLRFKAGALRDLNLPITVAAGSLGRLRVKIPWSNLWGAATEVVLQDIYVLAKPKQNLFDAEYEQRIQATKQKLLQLAEMMGSSNIQDPEEKKEAAEKAAKEAANKTSASWTDRLVATVINNLQVSIERIHIRYEDDQSNADNAFAVGVTLDSLSAQSCDENWSVRFVKDSSSLIRKLAKLNNLSVYWDTGAEPLDFPKRELFIQQMREQMRLSDIDGAVMQDPEHQYVVHPISGQLKVSINRKVDPNSTEPKVLVQGTLQNIQAGFHRGQYKDMLLLSDNLGRESKGALYRRYRPKLSPKDDPRAWLQYAGNVVLHDAKAARDVFSPQTLRRIVRNRRLYIQIWYKKKSNFPLTVDEERLLRELEDEMSFEAIMEFRKLGTALHDRRVRMAKETEQAVKREEGWLGSVWSAAGAEKDKVLHEEVTVSAGLIQELRKEMREKEQANAAIDQSIPPTYINMQLEVTLERVGLSLSSFELDKGVTGELLSAYVGGLSASVTQRPKWNSIAATVQTLQVVEYVTLPGRSRVMVAPSAPDRALLEAKVELDPLDNPAKTMAVVEARPLDVVFSMKVVDAMTEFFKPPKQSVMLDDFVSNTSNNSRALQRQASLELKRTIGETSQALDLRVTVEAPNIIVPLDFEDEHAPRLVLQLGTFSFASDPLRKQNAIYMRNGKKHVSSAYFYDSYKATLREVRVALAYDVNWQDYVQRFPLSLLVEDLSVRVNLDVLTFPTNALPTIKTDIGLMTALGCNVSALAICDVMRIANSMMPEPTQEDRELERLKEERAQLHEAQRKIAAEKQQKALKKKEAMGIVVEEEDEPAPADIEAYVPTWLLTHEADEKQLSEVFDEEVDGDTSDYVFDTDITETGDNPRVLLLALSIPEVSVLLFSQEKHDSLDVTPLVRFGLRQLSASVEEKKNNIVVELQLGALGMKDEIQQYGDSLEFGWLIDGQMVALEKNKQQENAENGPIINAIVKEGTSTAFFRVRYTGIPMSSPAYKGVAHDVQLHIGDLNIDVNRMTVLRLMDWTNRTLKQLDEVTRDDDRDAGEPPSPDFEQMQEAYEAEAEREKNDNNSSGAQSENDEDSKHKEEADGAIVKTSPSQTKKQQQHNHNDNSTLAKVHVVIGELRLRLNKARSNDNNLLIGAHFTTVHLESSTADVEMKTAGTMLLKASVGSLDVTHETAADPRWKQVAYVADEALHTLVAEFETYQRVPAEKGADRGNEVDSRVMVRMESIVVVYRNVWLEELLDYFAEMDDMQALMGGADTSGGDAAAAQSSDNEEGEQQGVAPQRMMLDVEVASPFIIIPRASNSDEILLVQLGNTSVMSRFTQKKKQSVQSLNITLSDLNMRTAVHQQENTEMPLLADTSLSVFITLPEDPKQKVLPQTGIVGSLQRLKMHVSEKQVRLIAGIISGNMCELRPRRVMEYKRRERYEVPEEDFSARDPEPQPLAQQSQKEETPVMTMEVIFDFKEFSLSLMRGTDIPLASLTFTGLATNVEMASDGAMHVAVALRELLFLDDRAANKGSAYTQVFQPILSDDNNDGRRAKFMEMDMRVSAEGDTLIMVLLERFRFHVVMNCLWELISPDTGMLTRISINLGNAMNKMMNKKRGLFSSSDDESLEEEAARMSEDVEVVGDLQQEIDEFSTDEASEGSEAEILAAKDVERREQQVDVESSSEDHATRIKVHLRQPEIVLLEDLRDEQSRALVVNLTAAAEVTMKTSGEQSVRLVVNELSAFKRNMGKDNVVTIIAPWKFTADVSSIPNKVMGVDVHMELLDALFSYKDIVLVQKIMGDLTKAMEPAETEAERQLRERAEVEVAEANSIVQIENVASKTANEFAEYITKADPIECVRDFRYVLTAAKAAQEESVQRDLVLATRNTKSNAAQLFCVRGDNIVLQSEPEWGLLITELHPAEGSRICVGKLDSRPAAASAWITYPDRLERIQWKQDPSLCIEMEDTGQFNKPNYQVYLGATDSSKAELQKWAIHISREEMQKKEAEKEDYDRQKEIELALKTSMVETLQIHFAGIRCRFVDDTWEQIDPLLRLNLRQTNFYMTGWSYQTQGLLDSAITFDYFNSKNQSYEPVLRGLSNQKEDVLASERAWSFQLKISREAEGAMVLEAMAHDALSLVVSRAMIENATRMQETIEEQERSSDQSAPPRFSVKNPYTKYIKDISEYHPYCIINNTGSLVQWYIQGEQDNTAEKTLLPTSGKNVAFFDGHDTERFSTHRPERYLFFKVDGIRDPLRQLPMEKSGLHCFNIGGPTLVYSVTYDRGTHFIELRGNVLLKSQCVLPIAIAADAADIVELEEQLTEGASTGVPLRFLQHKLRFQPRKSQEALVKAKKLETRAEVPASIPQWSTPLESMKFTREGEEKTGGRIALTKVLTCAHPTDKHAAPFSYAVSVEGLLDPHSEIDAYSWTVKINPPVIIRNFLAASVDYRYVDMKSTRVLQSGRIKPGETMQVHYYDEQNEYGLAISLEGLGWSDPGSINGMSVGSWLKMERDREELYVRLHHVEEAAAHQLTLFAPFWLVNKTNMSVRWGAIGISHKEMYGQFLEVHEHWDKWKNPNPADWFEPAGSPAAKELEKPVMYSGHKIHFKVGHSDWSKMLILAQQSDTGHVEVTCPHDPRVYQIGIHIFPAPGEYWRTNVVRITNRYVCVNKTGRAIRLRQLETEQEVHLEPEAEIPWHWVDGEKPRVMQMRLAESRDWKWCGAFKIEDTSLFEVRCTNPKDETRVRVTVQTSTEAPTTGIIFRPSTPTSSIYKVRNLTSNVPFIIKQAGVLEDDGEFVAPGQTIAYVWAEPAQESKRALITVPDGSVDRTSKEKRKKEKDDGHNANNQDKKPASYVMDKIETHSPILVEWKGNREKIVPAVVLEGPTKVLELRPHSLSRSAYGRPPPSIFFKVAAKMTGISVSVLNERPMEVTHLYLDEISASFQEGSEDRQIELNVQNIQIDSMLHVAVYPIVLWPKPADKMPFLHLAVNQAKNYNNIQFFNGIEFAIQEAELRVDEAFLTHVVRAINMMFFSSQAEADIYDVVDYRRMPDFKAMALDITDMIYARHLYIGPLKVAVSYAACPWAAAYDGDEVLEKTLGSVGMLTNMDQQALTLGMLQMDNAYQSKNELTNIVINHYVNEMLKKFYLLLGGVAFIGAPVTLASGIGTGVKDFFFEPAQGMMNGPGDFADGLRKGTSSLVKKSLKGLTGAAGKLTSAVGNVAGKLTFDDDYQEKRNRRNQKYTPQHAGEGFLYGGLALGRGFLDGVTGVVVNPVKGAQEDGAVGFLRGMGTGLVGLAMKPIAGTFDATTRVTQGLKNSTIYAALKNMHRVRLPRFVGPSSVIQGFDGLMAEGQAILYSVEDGKYLSEYYLFHYPNLDAVDYRKKREPQIEERLVLSNKHVLYVKGTRLGRMSLEWEIPLAQLKKYAIVRDAIVFLQAGHREVVREVRFTKVEERNYVFFRIAHLVTPDKPSDMNLAELFRSPDEMDAIVDTGDEKFQDRAAGKKRSDSPTPARPKLSLRREHGEDEEDLDETEKQVRMTRDNPDVVEVVDPANKPQEKVEQEKREEVADMDRDERMDSEEVAAERDEDDRADRNMNDRLAGGGV